jgi:hypothetical protein
LNFLFLWKISLKFWKWLHWTCRLLLVVWPFHSVDSTNPQAWKVFPSFDVLFNFFLQWLIVFDFFCEIYS